MRLLFFLFASCTDATPIVTETGVLTPGDLDGDGVGDEEDCGPEDAEVYAGARERCDGKDNDCNGEVDEIFDLDADGFLADEAACRQLAVETDCDDLDPEIHPGATEYCDGLDNDCNRITDDAADADLDGYGACEDCNDKDRYVNSQAPDVCDGFDNNCDGLVDPAFDEDGDGYSPCGGDCDEFDPTRSPGFAEICDGIDNNCDATVDEGFDEDADGQSTCEGDCDDTNPLTYLGNEEVCDGVENDCNLQNGETTDGDKDGFTLCSGDCDDTEKTVYPGATEGCDGFDNDCNGKLDELPACYGCVTKGKYALCSSGIPWAEAEQACQDLYGYHLVSLGGDAENSVIAEWVYQTVGNYAWIGLSDGGSEGTFLWNNGEAFGYSNWAGGQPDNAGNEDCVGIGLGDLYHWNDFPCESWSLPFVCEK